MLRFVLLLLLSSNVLLVLLAVSVTANAASAAPPRIQQLYETIINTDNLDHDTVLYGVPTSVAVLNGDKMFLLNLSFVAANVSDARLHFYQKPMRQFRQGASASATSNQNIRLAIYAIGKNGQPLRNAQYISMANSTEAGWTEVDLTDVINRLQRSSKRTRNLSVALQFEQQQRSGKMHQVAPNRFMLRRNGPYVILTSAAADTSNFYNWFEAVLKSGSSLTSESLTVSEQFLNESDEEFNSSAASANATLVGNLTQRADQADSPFVNLFGVPLYARSERVCAVRPWVLPVPRFLRKYIIHPPTLRMNRCAGSCVPGVSPEDFRNSLISRSYFDQLRRASRLQKCCVPDKLGPLEMVFLSAKDAQYVVSRVSMPNLVAESCKCIYTYL